MDHRQGERVRALAMVSVCQIDDEGECRAGLLYNVSQDGMFVLSTMRPAINSSLDVYIHFADNLRSICFPGQVVHANDHGFGLILRQVNRQNLWLISLLHENHRTKGTGQAIEDRQGVLGISKARA